MEPDKPLYTAALWRAMPKLLADLQHRGRLRVCVFEDTDRGEMTCFGVTGFVFPGLLDRALEQGEGLAETVLSMEMKGRAAFLNHKQVAEANRGDNLRAFTFFGVMEGADVNDPATRDTLVPIMEGWTFFHRGFSLAELWFEPVTTVLAQCMEKTGVVQRRERTLAGGEIARVFRLTRAEAEPMLPNWPAIIMFSPGPRFGFTRGEQTVLELALLDYSDREVAEELRVSPDAIKKRWRSIYARVARVDPVLLANRRSVDQRRDLLHTLRTNLQEIRPY